MKMTRWELRGYLTYPSERGKPRPGTPEEANWLRGWLKADREKVFYKETNNSSNFN